MRSIVTDGVSVAWSVCHDREPSRKTAEPIEMPFGLWSRVGPRNHVLDGVMNQDLPMGRGNFKGGGQPL